MAKPVSKKDSLKQWAAIVVDTAHNSVVYTKLGLTRAEAVQELKVLREKFSKDYFAQHFQCYVARLLQGK